MDTSKAVETLSALAQETRLEAFRLLVQHEPAGLPAGEIARRLDVPHNTLSPHLAVLARAGLVTSQRQSRSIIYRANLSHMQETIGFLVRDCCAGDPTVCEPLLTALVGCASHQDEQ
ncbi:MAG TPA: helix-turn-helix transcriptional regulator [Gammaproteobacteria bacterium]|nr:helix-turn-helix transcriptional regulator [Gammaproteobacteria bacterium]